MEVPALWGYLLMVKTNFKHCLAVLTCLIVATTRCLIAAEYSLADAIHTAQNNDPWLDRSRFTQQNLDALSVSAGAFPDPMVRVGFANVPIDSFDLRQEPMTQVQVGVSQTFPRGKSLSLRQDQLKKLSQIQPSERENRKASVAVVVADLWLEIYRNQKAISLIERDRSLFEYLVDVAESSYTTGAGLTRQQDLVRAQLELTRLDDRLAQLKQNKAIRLAKLGEWFGYNSTDIRIAMPKSLSLILKNPELINYVKDNSKNHQIDKQLLVLLANHPKIVSINQKVSAGEFGVTLAEQSYKPQWGVSASYGRRDSDSIGNDRSDFLSVGVNFDMPIFTSKRQDKRVQAAIAEKEGIKVERTLVLRQLRSSFEAAKSRYLGLIDRQRLFNTRLLKKTSEQAEASLTAYTNDDGDFAEVVRARIAELNARIDALNIDIDIQKTIAQINYFFVTSSDKKNANPTSLFSDRLAISGETYD